MLGGGSGSDPSYHLLMIVVIQLETDPSPSRGDPIALVSIGWHR
jgi:hypothetical protein